MNELLVAFDSDGCVFDAMEIKHRQAFGPAAVKVYGTPAMEAVFLEQWYRINLYSKTRGINRFPGLVMALDCMYGLGYDVQPQESLRAWCRETPKLSAGQLAIDAERTGDSELLKALEYSAEINRLTEEKAGHIPPYRNAMAAIERISRDADIAVVSSANTAAIEREWRENGFMPYVTELFGQEAGSKKDCLALLCAKGYRRVLMVGDAPGDWQAAQANDCLFYPIIPGDEENSWIALHGTVFDEFLRDEYREGNGYTARFLQVCG